MGTLLRRVLGNDLTTDLGAHTAYVTAFAGFHSDRSGGRLSSLPKRLAGGDHPALYLSSDAHLAEPGRAVFARAFAEAIGPLDIR